MKVEPTSSATARGESPLIEVRGVETWFGSKQIHRGVDFSVKKGVIAALIGGSGSGKSTLLREILRLLRPNAGEIFLFGRDVWNGSSEDLNDMRRRWGVMFQNGALFSALTVGENIAVPLKEQTNLDQGIIDSIVELRLGLTGLSCDTARKMPSELSGGMRKRVALARALALEPEILFLDEPTSGLDPINARAFDQLVRTLCDGLELTVFMVTHDLDSIHSIADQLIVLGDGRVIADGTVEEVAQSDHEWIREYFSARAA